MLGPGERWSRWRARTAPHRAPAPVGSRGTPALGEHRYEWCPHCRDFTLAAAPAYLLCPTGVTRMGTATVCETCGWTPGVHGAC